MVMIVLILHSSQRIINSVHRSSAELNRKGMALILENIVAHRLVSDGEATPRYCTLIENVTSIADF
jgi:hypothetical protein